MWLASRRNQPLEESLDPDPLAGYEDELGMAELMELFSKTKQTIRRWLTDNQIPGYMINGRWVVYKNELRTALNGSLNAPKTG